jgi:hypothetical protein
LRSFSLCAAYLRHRRGRRIRGHDAGDALLAALDRAAAPALSAMTRLAGSRAQPPQPGANGRPRRGVPAAAQRPVLTEELTPAALVEHLPRLTRGLRLAPDYDLPFAEWLFRELDLVPGRGRPVARLVRRGSQVVGMFIYFLLPAGPSLVVQIAAADGAATRAVVDALIDDATTAGAAMLHGRMEAGLEQAVAAAGGIMGYGGNALIHAPDPAVAMVATSGRALLTRLEGDRWMAPHLLDGRRAAEPVAAGTQTASLSGTFAP